MGFTPKGTYGKAPGGKPGAKPYVNGRKPAEATFREGGYKPKKKRAKRQKPPVAMSEEQQAQKSLEAATRRYKEMRADVYSHAKPASQAQLDMLAAALPGATYQTLLHFVEWSNGLVATTGSIEPRRGRIFLSRIYWIRAIDMALTGSNEFFSAEDLVAQSNGYDNHQQALEDYIAPGLFSTFAKATAD